MIQGAVFRQRLQNEGAETTHGAFLDRQQNLMLASETQKKIDIERFGETRIRDGGGEPASGQQVGGLQAIGQSGAERQDSHRRAFAHDPPTTDLQRLREIGDRNADAIAPGKQEGAGAIVDGRGRGDHVRKFRFVRRGP